MLINTITFILSYYVSNYFIFFFFNPTAPTYIYTLSLHDALPILTLFGLLAVLPLTADSYYPDAEQKRQMQDKIDRKSTRLNSSHVSISYAVFCLKKKIS